MMLQSTQFPPASPATGKQHLGNTLTAYLYTYRHIFDNGLFRTLDYDSV